MEKIPVKGGEIGAFSEGHGPALIFLHGGPGDTHHYMRRMAEPLIPDFQCIFFDQRGSGASVVERDPPLFALDQLLEDLLAVTTHFELSSPALVGHSWGAIYALHASLRFPSLFPRSALLSMGPLDEEAGKETSAQLEAALDAEEKDRWTKLRAARNQAREKGDREAVETFDRELMRLRVKSWVARPELREAFLTEYFLDPPPDREVNLWIWQQAAHSFSWDLLEGCPARFWLCSGDRDFASATQARRFPSRLPSSSVTILENCGHIPWLECPDFYPELRSFLKGSHVPS